MLETGTDTIVIKETEAPNHYKKLIDSLTLSVTKTISGGNYVASNVSITSGGISGTTATITGNTIKVVVPNEKKVFDLALRKFITKVNGVNVQTSREPEVGAFTLDNGTTLGKTHTKNPLVVNVGDTILYTIRVYNEGEIAGYATEITDYLPEGLSLKGESQVNLNNGWENPSNDGKTIVSSKLENTLLNSLSFADIEVECLVTAGYSSNEQRYKNIAEITEDADENKNPIDDRDSVPENLTNEQKDNYNPGTSEQGKGYQDDDDFEEILIPGINGSYQLQIEKIDRDNHNIKLQDAKFTVKINNSSESDILTTNLSGIINLRTNRHRRNGNRYYYNKRNRSSCRL